MAFYYSEPSHTFSEYLLIPGYTAEDCVPANVSLRTPLTRFRKGEEPAISLNIPMVSAIMQSVSDDKLAIALAKEGGLSFIYGAQSIKSEAAMVARVKNHKAGFVVSASNLTPDSTLADVLALKAKNGYSTVAITDDGTANGRPARHRFEPRLPRLPHGRQPEGQHVHDAAGKARHRASADDAEGSKRHHLGA